MIDVGRKKVWVLSLDVNEVLQIIRYSGCCLHGIEFRLPFVSVVMTQDVAKLLRSSESFNIEVTKKVVFVPGQCLLIQVNTLSIKKFDFYHFQEN